MGYRQWIGRPWVTGVGPDGSTRQECQGAVTACGSAEVAHDEQSDEGLAMAAKKRAGEDEDNGLVLVVGSDRVKEGRRRLVGAWLGAPVNFYSDQLGRRRFRPGNDQNM